MMERYSHIRMDAKRTAVEALATKKQPEIREMVPKDSPKVRKLVRVK